MSRTIFAVLLGAGLAVSLGCGSKPAPTQSTPQENPAPGSATPDPNAGAAKADAVKVAHELDQAKHVIPAAPVRGAVGGAEFVPSVSIQGDQLEFSVFKKDPPEVERSLKLRLAPMHVAGQPLPPILGREWKVKSDGEAGPGVPHVWVELPGKDPVFASSGYALTLELGARKGDKVPGKIYVSLPDQQKTVLAGTFEAEYLRTSTERPGPDDAPYIGGDVTVANAKPGAEVRVAYAGFTPSGEFKVVKELQGSFDAKPPELAQWTQDEEKKSRLVSGDGKAWPFRYEHVKLPPGRYLVSAGIVGGPAAWKWVDLPANGALTENFALDAEKTGGVEVSVPADATGKVDIAPADDARKAPLEADLFRVLSFQVVRQDVNVVAGKAVFKNLGPGKYEVRVGELKGSVEVAAGKTAELALTAPKKP